MSQKRKEIDEVTQKVQNTKKEIDHLKAELEKLISTGINSANSFNFNAVNKENLQAPENKPDVRIKFRHVSDVDKQPDVRKVHQSRRTATTKLQAVPSSGSVTRNLSKSPECNRKCLYNRREAQEYIKKQREKRKEMAKLTSKENEDLEAKKLKLKELHKKSLLLVKKNVEQKRKRSKSRETIQQTENVAQERGRDIKNEFPAVSHIPDLIMTNVVDNKHKKEKIAQKSNKHDCEANKKPSQCCSSEKICVEDCTYSGKTDEAQNPYIETEFLDEAATKIQAQYRGYQQRKQYKQMKDAKSKTIAANATKTTTETQTENKSAAIPDWLNPLTLSHPYNFISTVKRKLNFVINSSPSVKLNVPVQASSDVEPKTPKQESFQKTMNELREAIEKSAKSNKCGGGNLEELVAQKRAQIGTDQGVHSKNSDSDTSKDIPNISNESSVHSILSDKIKGSRALGNSQKEYSVDTDYPTDSDFSEAKLNTDKLKDLKLQQRKDNNYVKKSKETVHSKKPYAKEKQTSKDNSSASSIKTIKSFSESDIISSNTSKYSSGNKQKSDLFPGKSTVMVDDIIAFNVSSSRDLNKSTNEKNAAEQLQPPSNLALSFPKQSQSSTSQGSAVCSDHNSYSSNFSVVSSKQFLTVPSLKHPDVSMYPALEKGEETENALSKKLLEIPALEHPDVGIYPLEKNVVSRREDTNIPDANNSSVEEQINGEQVSSDLTNKSKSSSLRGSTVHTDHHSFSSNFSVGSSKNVLAAPPLEHPDSSIYPSANKANVEMPDFKTSNVNVLSLKEGDKATLDTKVSFSVKQ